MDFNDTVTKWLIIFKWGKNEVGNHVVTTARRSKEAADNVEITCVSLL